MKNDLTFITNEEGKSLKDRLKKLIHPDTQFFDCLVGYFYLSGFHLLHPTLTKTEKIRILVGLRTDGQVYGLVEEAKAQRSLEFEPYAKIKDDVEPTVKSELESIQDSQTVEDGIRTFVEWCKSGKLEVRVYPSRNIHAKLYIMTFFEEDKDLGRVITGSSNFSYSGLEGNLEFNVELKNASDYKYAIDKFNELWEQSVEVTEEYVDAVTTKTHLALLSPKEIYLKFLYEYFRTELNQSRELDQDYQPDNFLRLQYQHDAVLTAKRVLEEYNGVFLADVVGLGKTYMAAMLARELDGRCIVIAPPALIDENNPGSWGNVLHDFGVRGFKTYSIGKLDAILKLDLSKFKYVFIDEAHRFRNEDTETYAKLHRICRNKKVILVTATPFNNRPNDLLSQLKLFQHSRNSTLPYLPNLDNFFRQLNKRLQPLDRVADRDEYLKVMRENAREVRERILKYLMVRRTRTEIARFYDEDLAKQNLKFPEVEAPRAVFYELSQRENEIFTRTIERIAKRIKYARYRPLTYLPSELIDETSLAAQFNLAGFMKVLLVKRLESSFEAFRLTLTRFIKAYERFLSAYRGGYVYISKKRSALIFELIETGDFEAIEALVESEEAERYDAQDFNPNFESDLQNDLTILREILADWETIKRDPKWEKFLWLLKNDPILQKNKILLFTESRETAEYLSLRISESLNEEALCFSGSSKRSLREEVIDNFDARVRKPQDKYRILVTTDSLAEGVSLHRSNTVINYDIPWNPTRMMQRVGRINRVDTKFETIYTYNFFPSKEGNDEIALRESAEAKIEAFIEMLGADARLLTENEEIKSFNLFDRITSKETITGESEADEESELKYLQIIRDIQTHEKELFAHIRDLPKKARAAQDSPTHQNKLFTYFRLGKLDKFYLASMDSPTSEEIDFLDAAKLLETDSEEKLVVGRDFFELLEKNKGHMEDSLHADHETVYAPASSRDIISKLRRRMLLFKNDQMLDFTEDDQQLWHMVVQDLQHGAVAKQTANNVWKAVEKVSQAREVLEILKGTFSLDGRDGDETQNVGSRINLREVILSEHFR
ncbi:MAG: helicase-related protein [bacterium]|nr:helicase-related protein [bacterium]